MKRFTTLGSFIAVAVLLAACGAEPPPTLNVADVQSTAVSAAFTIVAETQAAIPTATPLPPTETATQTPLPTETPIALPTIAELPSSTPASSSAGGDPCATRVLGKPLGKETTIRIVNTTRAAISVSLYLNETASHNECGWRQYNLSKTGSVVITDLVYGCYNLWAWNTDGKNNFNSAGYGCINNPDKWTFEVNTDYIKFIGP